MTGTAKEKNRIETRARRGPQVGNYWPDLNEKKCHECGKVIFITPGWVYKRGRDYRLKYFCSWGCMCKFDKKRATRDYTRIK